MLVQQLFILIIRFLTNQPIELIDLPLDYINYIDVLTKDLFTIGVSRVDHHISALKSLFITYNIS